MDQPVAARAAALRRLSSDHAIDRAAFVRCCVELCMHLPPDTLDLAISAFRATVDTLESRQTEQCVERAHKVDQFAKCARRHRRLCLPQPSFTADESTMPSVAW